MYSKLIFYSADDYNELSLETSSNYIKVIDDSGDHFTNTGVEICAKSHHRDSDGYLEIGSSALQFYIDYNDNDFTGERSEFGFRGYYPYDPEDSSLYYDTNIWGIYPYFAGHGMKHRSEIGSKLEPWDRICSESFIITPPESEKNIANTVTIEHRGIGTDANHKCSWVSLNFSPNPSSDNLFSISGNIEARKLSIDSIQKRTNNGFSIYDCNSITTSSLYAGSITGTNGNPVSTISATSVSATNLYIDSIQKRTNSGFSIYDCTSITTSSLYAASITGTNGNPVSTISATNVYVGDIYGLNSSYPNFHGKIPHIILQNSNSNSVSIDVGTIILLAIAGFTESNTDFYFYAGSTVSATSSYYGLYVGMIIQTGSTNSQYFSFVTHRRITEGSYTLLSDANRMNTGADRIFVLAMRTA